jgi:anti-anti-sigma factor
MAASTASAEPNAHLRVEQVTPRAVVAVFEGEHDVATSGQVRDTLASLVENNSVVVADLSVAEFIDSSIIHALVEADRTARGRGSTFRLQLGTARIVRVALEVTGLLDEIECAPTRAEAVAAA